MRYAIVMLVKVTVPGPFTHLFLYIYKFCFRQRKGHQHINSLRTANNGMRDKAKREMGYLLPLPCKVTRHIKNAFGPDRLNSF